MTITQVSEAVSHIARVTGVSEALVSEIMQLGASTLPQPNREITLEAQSDSMEVVVHGSNASLPFLFWRGQA
jgi:hypothetical protein